MAPQALAGIRIVVTRARAQAASLCRRIEALGGEVIEIPTIEIHPPNNFAALDAVLGNVESYDWIMFTSVNSVEPFVERLKHVGRSVADLKHLKIVAIGSETAKQLKAAGIAVALVPTCYQAERILDALDSKKMSGKRVLIPRAAKARDLLPETLRQWGASVDVIEAYRTLVPAVDTAEVKRRLQRGEVDVITFTSSSTVSHFAQLFGGAALSSIAGNAAIACIGPITAKTVEDLGGRADIMAAEYTIDGLVRAMVDYFNSTRGISRAKPQSTPRDKKKIRSPKFETISNDQKAQSSKQGRSG